MNLKNVLHLNSPFSRETDVLAVAPDFDDAFSRFTRAWLGLRSSDVTSPRVDVTELDDRIDITAELPGLEQKDVTVEVLDGVLTVSGQKAIDKTSSSGKRHVSERRFGAFSRSMTLPEGVEASAIKASMASGVLTVSVPKPTAPKAEPQKIAIEERAKS